MQADPIFEWQRLTEHYRQMSDGELLELAADFRDLTEAAQQALRSEMRSRGLGEPEAANAPPVMKPPTGAVIAQVEPEPGIENPAVPLGGLGRVPELVPDGEEPGAKDEEPQEFTWKTVLCDCETNEEAQQRAEILRQSGIDSWIERPMEFGRRYARVLVAADQLEQARLVARKPIPQEIVDESRDAVPDYQEPKCPKCGAGDPTLESVEPTNHWRCEDCGAEWSDPPETPCPDSAKSQGRAP